jgi:glycosyltransferase involved in cell wall biosynthesis
MKVLAHSNAPFVGSGYAVQTDLVSRWLAKHGHEVFVSAFYGLRGATFNTGNITILPGSNEQWGNDMIVAHYDFYRPDVLFLLMDAWVLEDKVLGAVPAAVWTPVDHEPIPPAVAEKLKRVKFPIAMSRHGERQMRQVMIDPLYVPHMVDTNVYKPMDKATARAAYGVNDDRFVITSVGANKGYPTRKNFDRMLKAWALFLKQHPGGLLYVHTNPYQSGGGLDLLEVCEFYNLKAHIGSLDHGQSLDGYDVAFPDVYRMLRGDYSSYTMNHAYNMADAFLLPSAGGGFEIPLIEAQAAGTPVITTAFTAMNELAEAGYRIPIDPADDVVYTLQNSEQALPKTSEIMKGIEWAYNNRGNQKLRDDAREFAMGYDVDRIMTRYMLPVMKTIALGTADYMRFEQWRKVG